MVYKRKPTAFSPQFEVVSCFCEFEDTILLLKQREGKFQGGRWGVPAGKVSDSEFLIDAIIRETKEETKISLPLVDLEYLQKVYITFAEFDFVYHMYKVVFIHKPDVSIDAKEHTEYRWVKPAEALQLNLIEDEDTCIKMWYK